MLRMCCLGLLALLIFTSASFFALGANVNLGNIKTLDGTINPDSVIVLIKNKEPELFATSANIPDEMNGILSVVVEKFLRQSIQANEDRINPPRYTEMSYISPEASGQEGLGMIDRNGTAHAVNNADVPATAREALDGAVKKAAN